MSEGRNPKAEGRRKSEIRMNFALCPLSDFGFRPSDLFRHRACFCNTLQLLFPFEALEVSEN
jgi:hypothetical protein